MGELQCRDVAVWEVRMWGSSGVGKLQCGVVVVWDSCAVGKL